MGFGPLSPLWIRASVRSTLLATIHKVRTQTDSLGLIQANLLAFLLRRVLQYDAGIFQCQIILELHILSPSLHNQSVHMQTTTKKTQIRPRGYKLFSCSTQLSTKFILLINVKMPTIVGILTFSKINTASEKVKAIKLLICRGLLFL